ncbi:MAG: 30S ribosomal protein S19 [Candidatus Woesearchaeota archaeon]
MALKEFKYRSRSLDDLKQMTLDELAEILPSRARRTIKRGFSEEHKNLIKKIEKKDNVKTHFRDMIVLPSMVGRTVQIHSGKNFQPVTLTEEMIGHYFGEFVLTRKRAAHTNVGVTNKPKK